MLDFDFGLGEDLDLLRESVQAFAADRIAPRAEAIDRDNEFPRDLWPELGELGLLGLDREHGGVDRLREAAAGHLDQRGGMVHEGDRQFGAVDAAGRNAGAGRARCPRLAVLPGELPLQKARQTLVQPVTRSASTPGSNFA